MGIASSVRLLPAALAVCFLAAACSQPRSPQTRASATPPSPAPPSPSPSPTFPPPALDKVAAKATLVAAMDQPVALAYRKDDSKLYIVERRGRVRTLTNNALDPNPILDITGETSFESEQGLLGIAFSPDGGRMHINFTNRAGDSRVVEFQFPGGNIDPNTRREVLALDQPFVNHNGGNLVFGPDGKLWIGFGDGGSGNDPQDNGQSMSTLLGKMLRIDPAPSASGAYTIPPDNPFVASPGARPEIWALGLRNPWRYSFDRVTGDLWIGDVGQYAQEEIDFMAAGQGKGVNYGWARLEGNRRVRGTPPAGAIPPIHTYPLHSDGRCAVVGGFVYRGSRISGLHGAYLYGDNCDGKVRALVQQGGQIVDSRDLGVVVDRLASFGEGPDGEIYVMSLTRGLFRLDPA